MKEFFIEYGGWVWFYGWIGTFLAGYLIKDLYTWIVNERSHYSNNRHNPWHMLGWAAASLVWFLMIPGYTVIRLFANLDSWAHRHHCGK